MRFLKFFLHVLCLVAFVLPFFSCHDSDDSVDDNVLEVGDTALRTVLVYMMAENSLSDYASSDLNEMLAGVSSLPDDCHLLAFVDDIRKPRILRFHKKENRSVCDTVYLFEQDFYSTDTACFRLVLDWVLEEYPAKGLGLVMWSHGSGWLRDANRIRNKSIGIDNGENKYYNISSYAHSMEIEEMACVLQSLPINTDFILFDACFMQSIEVAYALRRSADWLLASPAELPADGAPYNKIVEGLFTFPFNPKEVLMQYKSAYSDFAGVVLSAVKLDAVSDLAYVTASVIPAYFTSTDNIYDSKIFSYLPGGYFSKSISYPSYYDMNCIMSAQLPNDVYILWKEVFDKVVPYKIFSNGWYSGINASFYAVDSSLCGGCSMYVPFDLSLYLQFNSDFRTTEWYSDAGWGSAGW